MPTTPRNDQTPNARVVPAPRRLDPQDSDVESIEALEAVLETTGVAAMFDMAPLDLAIVFVHGTTGPGSTIEISDPVQQIADAADGNVRLAAYVIAARAVASSWYRLLMAPRS